MIISTKKGTPKDELEKIVDKFEKQGLDVTLITGKDYNVFGLVGDSHKPRVVTLNALASYLGHKDYASFVTWLFRLAYSQLSMPKTPAL